MDTPIPQTPPNTFYLTHQVPYEQMEVGKYYYAQLKGTLPITIVQCQVQTIRGYSWLIFKSCGNAWHHLWVDLVILAPVPEFVHLGV